MRAVFILQVGQVLGKHPDNPDTVSKVEIFLISQLMTQEQLIQYTLLNIHCPNLCKFMV